MEAVDGSELPGGIVAESGLLSRKVRSVASVLICLMLTKMNDISCALLNLQLKKAAAWQP